ncbi:hypothetical protein ARMGADRAFT_992305 [Armillaria gallica]|uniref:BTB domain-containing protein n=1 Tax=Armillaria gallica TaxID=47427 RepID=A0A2H3DQB6_ARMGA|nr:hypothetical protein ARMGADRAFT_992305 [Armillaria gallica]
MTIADPPFNDPADSVDLVIRTADKVDFFVLSGLLSLKSPSSFFRHVLKSSQHTEERDGYPVLEVEEDSDTFRTILLLCYPDVAAQIKDVDQIVAVTKALDKYCMDHTLDKFVQAVIASPLMKEQALGIFAYAVANGWRVLGEAAAKNTLTIPLDDLEVELEELCSINALQYVRLRKYHRKCGRAAQDMLSKSDSTPWLQGKLSELLFTHSHYDIGCRWCGRRLECLFSSPEFRTHLWFTNYLTVVKTEVLRRPHPETALDATIRTQAIVQSISQCPEEEWKKMASSQIHLCGKFLMEEIDKQISQVPLNIDWTK